MNLFSKQEELIMLTLFRLKDNAYLVTIKEHLSEHAGKDWAFGSLYVVLDRLKKNNLIQTYLGEPVASRGGKAIQYYKLTDEGIAALRETKKMQDKMWREFSEYNLETL